ncbi:uncharacterized protein PAC_18338 [Phialocephala subalpina]|uniref:C2H2-type domain-containing protein n=1 Tax=Phialocephala subalpina TaxID=576137 RepID=A0A1L7XTU0_9HELO|nr:uncharacterized protein PAC_18338 [Phialocephala subalpina]
MELDAYQEGMPVEYTDGGTMALNVVECVDEAITAGIGFSPDLASCSQVIFPAPEDITSGHEWSVPHTLSSLDSEVDAQLAQTYQAQLPFDDISPSTTSILNFQASGNSLVLLPGSYSQLSQPQGHHIPLTRHDDGIHIDTSFPVYQNATPQCPFMPYSAGNTTIETHDDRTPVIDKKSYCSWPGCRQPNREYTAGELKKHLKTHIKPKKCPYYPNYCAWKGAAEERERQAHLKNNHEPRSILSFTCSNCLKSYTEKKNLTRHQKKCYARK